MKDSYAARVTSKANVATAANAASNALNPPAKMALPRRLFRAAAGFATIPTIPTTGR